MDIDSELNLKLNSSEKSSKNSSGKQCSTLYSTQTKQRFGRNSKQKIFQNFSIMIYQVKNKKIEVSYIPGSGNTKDKKENEKEKTQKFISNSFAVLKETKFFNKFFQSVELFENDDKSKIYQENDILNDKKFSDLINKKFELEDKIISIFPEKNFFINFSKVMIFESNFNINENWVNDKFFSKLNTIITQKGYLLKCFEEESNFREFLKEDQNLLDLKFISAIFSQKIQMNQFEVSGQLVLPNDDLIFCYIIVCSLLYKHFNIEDYILRKHYPDGKITLYSNFQIDNSELNEICKDGKDIFKNRIPLECSNLNSKDLLNNKNNLFLKIEVNIINNPDICILCDRAKPNKLKFTLDSKSNFKIIKFKLTKVKVMKKVMKCKMTLKPISFKSISKYAFKIGKKITVEKQNLHSVQLQYISEIFLKKKKITDLTLTRVNESRNNYDFTPGFILLCSDLIKVKSCLINLTISDQKRLFSHLETYESLSLVISHSTNLRTLKLDDNAITQDYMGFSKIITVLCENKSVKELSLSRNLINNDKNIDLVTEMIKRNKTMVHLQLSYNIMKVLILNFIGPLVSNDILKIVEFISCGLENLNTSLTIDNKPVITGIGVKDCELTKILQDKIKNIHLIFKYNTTIPLCT
jgi:hypothetical protein